MAARKSSAKPRRPVAARAVANPNASDSASAIAAMVGLGCVRQAAKVASATSMRAVVGYRADGATNTWRVSASNAPSRLLATRWSPSMSSAIDDPSRTACGNTSKISASVFKMATIARSEPSFHCTPRCSPPSSTICASAMRPLRASRQSSAPADTPESANARHIRPSWRISMSRMPPVRKTAVRIAATAASSQRVWPASMRSPIAITARSIAMSVRVTV